MAKQPKGKAAADAAEQNAGTGGDGAAEPETGGPRPLGDAANSALARLTEPGAEPTLKGLTDALGELLTFADLRAAYDDERHAAGAALGVEQAEYIDMQVASVREEITALRAFAEAQLADIRKDVDNFKSAIMSRIANLPAPGAGGAGGAPAPDPNAVNRYLYHGTLHARRVRSAAELERARADGFHDTPRLAAEALGLPPEQVAAKAAEIHARGAEVEVRRPGA